MNKQKTPLSFITDPALNKELSFILSPQAIRERTQALYQHAKTGGTHFDLHEEKLPELASFVETVVRENYPALNIPYHSRWQHFQVGGVDRLKQINEAWKKIGVDRDELVRQQLELAIVSVLLDAGAGDQWRYEVKSEGKSYQRSEGLALASFFMLQAAPFWNAKTGLHVSSEQLSKLTVDQLGQGFQVSDKNPLVGLEGRLALLKNLGKTIKDQPHFFVGGRLGGLWDYWKQVFGLQMQAQDVLQTVLLALGPIWPGRLQKGGVSLGDVWNYAPLAKSHKTSEFLIPFHKLSQWLSYSLLAPLETGGMQVQNIDGLTGLAEYRNGGLFIDAGVLTLKSPELLKQAHLPDSELVIEWRALTLALLEKLAPLVRAKLGKNEQELPLGKILEGGTWWAGRKIAAKLRPAGGGPPLILKSDGTVF